MIRSGDPWAGLDDFHRTALDFMAEVHEQESQSRWREVHRSLAHEAALIETVKSQLAAAAGSPPETTDDAGDGEALASAGRAVCDALGIEVRAPQAGGDRNPEVQGDPLTELARASGFQVRPVSLREGWWRRRGEPLLGQLLDEGRLSRGLAPREAIRVPAPIGL